MSIRKALENSLKECPLTEYKEFLYNRIKTILDMLPEEKEEDKDLIIIHGRASQYDSGLLAYICKYGKNPIFGPISKRCVRTNISNVYNFSFMSKKPTEAQMRMLETETIWWEIKDV